MNQAQLRNMRVLRERLEAKQADKANQLRQLDKALQHAADSSRRGIIVDFVSRRYGFLGSVK